MVLLTDGRSQDDVGNPAKSAKNFNIRTFAIGVGEADESELKLIATPPFSDTLYYVDNYDAIKQLQDTLAFKFCEDIEPIPDGGSGLPYGSYGVGQCSCPAGPLGPVGQPGPPGQSGIDGEPGAPGVFPDDYMRKESVIRIARKVVSNYIRDRKNKN
jgi:hypothetical protein